MAEADVAELGGVHEPGELLPEQWEHAAETGVKEQRLFIADEEVAELEIDVRNEDGDAVDLRRNFCG